MKWRVLEFLQDFLFQIVIMVIVTITGTAILTMITGHFWGSLAVSGLAGAFIAQSTIIIN